MIIYLRNPNLDSRRNTWMQAIGTNLWTHIYPEEYSDHDCTYDIHPDHKRFYNGIVNIENRKQIGYINMCTILDSDNTAGGNCLTFISKSIYGTV